jgi:hypothetical protein
VKEIRDKWKNLHSTAKKEFCQFKKKSNLTGGGSPPKEPSPTSSKIIEVLGETPTFTGLTGFETGKLAFLQCKIRLDS